MSGDVGDGIKNATDGHSQGGGVEKVSATRRHNTPRVEASTSRRLSGGGGGGVIKLKLSKSGLRGGIEGKGLSLRGGVDVRRGLRGDVDGVGDTISKHGSSGIYLRACSVRDGQCGQGVAANEACASSSRDTSGMSGGSGGSGGAAKLSPQSQASLDQGTRVIQEVVLPVRLRT
jgi:hypothetical protein